MINKSGKKKVVIISSSPRLNGNSDMLSKQFEKGALESGHEVKYFNLAKYKLGYCLGCYVCAKEGKCFYNDGMEQIAKEMIEADVILFSTPVYFYSMSGQLKVLIDRLVPYYTQISAEIYMILTAADDIKDNLLSTAESIRGATRDCFEDCIEKDVLYADSLTDKNDVLQRKDYLEYAFNMGKNC